MKKRWLMGTSFLALSLLVGCGEPTVPDNTDQVTDDTEQNGDNNEDDTPSTPVEKTYSITIGETNDVVLKLDKYSAKPGEKVTITVLSVPDEKTIKKISTNVKGVDVISSSSTEYYFLMGKEDVTLTVSIADAPKDTYSLTIENEVNAEIVTLMDSQQNEILPEANNVYQLAPNESYTLRLKSTILISVRLNGKAITSQEGYYMFAMPAKDSTLTISELQAHSLTLDYDKAALSGIFVMDSNNDYKEVQLNAIEEGTSIHVEITLNVGYEMTGAFLNEEPLETHGNSIDFTFPYEDSVLKIETEQYDVDGGLVTFEAAEGAKIEIGQGVNNDNSLVSIPQYNPLSTIFKTGTKLYLKAYIMDNWKSVCELDEVTVNGSPVTLDEHGIAEFTVADGGTKIVATTKNIEYDLLYIPTGKETCTFFDENNLEITKAVRNQKVKAVFYPNNANLALYSVKENGEIADGTIEGNTYTFIFTHSSSLTLTAEWADITKTYNISYSTTPASLQDLADVKFYEKNLILSTTRARPLVTIYMEVGTLEGYVFDGATLDGKELEKVTLDGKVYYTFKMPNKDANLELVFSEDSGTHDITFDDSNVGDRYIEIAVYDSSFILIGGRFTRDVPTGETIYIDIWVQGGATFKLFANGTEVTERATISPDGSPLNTYKYLMPNEDVTFTFEF